MFYLRTRSMDPLSGMQQTAPDPRLIRVISRSVATQFAERLTLIALACGSIFVLLPAILRAVASD